VVSVGGVRIVGISNLAGRIAADASSLYARNLAAFIALLVDKTGALVANPDDEILKSALVTHGGDIIHPALLAV
jgi:NAD(P) transhydrogenase subunit alpha